MELMHGIIVTIVAEIILMIVLTIWTNIRKKKWLSRICSKIFKHGVECVYQNQAQAINDIKKDIENSNGIKIFCMRGRSFIQYDQPLSYILEKRNFEIKYLLADPNSSFVEKRAQEINKIKSYKGELENNLSDLFAVSGEKKEVEVRTHRQPAVFRLIILDDSLYLSFFTSDLGSQLNVFKINKESLIYEGFNRYFKMIWDISA